MDTTYKRIETVVFEFTGEAGEAAFNELMDTAKNGKPGVHVRLLAHGNEIERLEKLLDKSNIEEY